MARAMNNHYGPVSVYDQSPAAEQLRREYDQWSDTIDAAHEQVKQFFALTGAYPIVGDELHVCLPKPAYRSLGLLVTKRLIYSDSDVELEHMQMIYEVEGAAEEMEELEYQEDDLVDEEN